MSPTATATAASVAPLATIPDPGAGAAADGVALSDGLLRRQEILREVIESISGELVLRPLLTRIVRHACELLQAGHGTIGLVDDARQVVRIEAVYRMPDDELGAELPPGVGLAGHVLRTQAAIILDRYGDIAQPTQPNLSQHAVIGMPIAWCGRMIGFFGVGAEPPRRFGPQDLETLAVFGRHAAIAIENARRYEREQWRIERLSRIARIGRLIAADLLLDDLLQKAADAIHELLGYPNIAIPLIDPDEPDALVLRTVGGNYRTIVHGEYRIPISQGLMGAAARDRRVVLVNDVEADPRYLPTPGATGICAELAVPIMLGDRVLGVLNVERGTPFDEEDASSLEIIADQLAVAIENARLFATMKRTLDETRLLYETSRRIGGALEEGDVIRAYLAQVALYGRYNCTVALYDCDATGQRTAVLVKGRWTPREGALLVEERLPYTRDALDPLLDAGQTVTIADVHHDARVSDELRRIQRQDGRPALALIPLLARGQRIGLVVLSHSRVHDWPEAALRKYEVTAAQLASAIDSRRQQRLLATRGQQLAVLEERRRLAGELHDSVTQLLFSTTLIAQSVAPVWRRDPVEGERRIERLLELSRTALAEMRELLFELRPPESAYPADPSRAANAAERPSAAGPPASNAPGVGPVRRLGLVTGLREYAAAMSHDALRIDLDASGYVAPGAQGTAQDVGHDQITHEEALYRIAQEAIGNALKHSRGHSVVVRLWIEDGATRLTVTDDGVGFADPAARRGNRSARQPVEGAGPHVAPRRGLGLTTMRERAAACGGTLRLTTTPGRGATVDVTIPWTAPAAE